MHYHKFPAATQASTLRQSRRYYSFYAVIFNDMIYVILGDMGEIGQKTSTTQSIQQYMYLRRFYGHYHLVATIASRMCHISRQQFVTAT